VEIVVIPWLITPNTGFCQPGMKKSVPRLDKCLGIDGHSVEKWGESVVIKSELI
jgi:hypothetical protein